MTSDESDMHVRMAELVRDLQTHAAHGSHELYDAITERVLTVVPGVSWAGITLTRHKHIESAAPTHPIARQVDKLQEQHGDGPCVRAARDHDDVHIDDVRSDERWPELLSDIIVHTPVRSTLSLRLAADGDTIGALNLYADRPRAFDDEAVEIGRVYATHAAGVLRAARRDEQFRDALASRDVIGQAKGMIMERFDVDATRAFELLRKLSQDSNVAVAKIARKLIDREHPDMDVDGGAAGGADDERPGDGGSAPNA